MPTKTLLAIYGYGFLVTLYAIDWDDIGDGPLTSKSVCIAAGILIAIFWPLTVPGRILRGFIH